MSLVILSFRRAIAATSSSCTCSVATRSRNSAIGPSSCPDDIVVRAWSPKPSSFFSCCWCCWYCRCCCCCCCPSCGCCCWCTASSSKNQLFETYAMAEIARSISLSPVALPSSTVHGFWERSMTPRTGSHAAASQRRTASRVDISSVVATPPIAMTASTDGASVSAANARWLVTGRHTCFAQRLRWCSTCEDGRHCIPDANTDSGVSTTAKSEFKEIVSQVDVVVAVALVVVDDIAMNQNPASTPSGNKISNSASDFQCHQA